MGKNLVIVESPAKAKTINKYLGSDYKVLASIGHIKDLPTNVETGNTQAVLDGEPDTFMEASLKQGV